MSKNKNFALNIPGVDKEISLPLDKVEELIMIMNQMDKSGISEEETRRIVLEEFLKFQKEKLDERYLKQRFQQSGDGNSVQDSIDHLKLEAQVLDAKMFQENPSTLAAENAFPNIVVCKNSTTTPLSPIELLNNPSKIAAKDLEVDRNGDNSRYPILVSSDDIVTIFPSKLVEKFLNDQKNKKPRKEDFSLLLITICIFGVSMGVLYYMKSKGLWPTKSLLT
ncbi:uncharacterized protein isoform X2 [Rhodnius prolixus]|uniref:uncharacterized protein isoform X2 n=1 Tax=Rhodnius prolixus TaxID=13249 RepID=UPI003D188A1E